MKYAVLKVFLIKSYNSLRYMNKMTANEEYAADCKKWRQIAGEAICHLKMW